MARAVCGEVVKMCARWELGEERTTKMIRIFLQFILDGEEVYQ